MRLTDPEKTLLRMSLITLETECETLTRVFHQNLRSASPDLAATFGCDRIDTSRQSMLIFSAIAAFADDKDAYCDFIGELALHHVGYGVRSEHYLIVSTALEKTLRQVFGRNLSQDTYEAWSKACTNLSGTMIAAACREGPRLVV